MALYQEQRIKELEKSTKKWVMIDIFSGLISLSIFVFLCICVNDDTKLLFQLISSIVLALFALVLVYSIDVVILTNHSIKKHYILSLISGSDIYESKVLSINKLVTVSSRIEAYSIEVETKGKNIILYLFKEFEPTFKVGDKLTFECKNRFIYEIKEYTHE